MKLATTVWTAAIVLILSLPAHAQKYFYDGYALMQDCHEEEALPADKYYQKGVCVGYIIGVMDALVTAETLTGYTIKCEVPDIRVGQAKLIVERYLDTHPQYLHRAASDIIASAVREAFPCGRTH